MVALDWSSQIEIETLDGRSLGPARLRLWGFVPEDQTQRWRGELVGSLLGRAKPWPAHEPVRLLLPSGASLVVRLEAGVRELSPVLHQFARIHAEPDQLKDLVLSSLVA